MTDVAAAFGIEQLKTLDDFNEKRMETAGYYLENLGEYAASIQLLVRESCMKHTFYAFPFVVRESAPFSRAGFARYLEGHNIETRALFGGACQINRRIGTRIFKVWVILV